MAGISMPVETDFRIQIYIDEIENTAFKEGVSLAQSIVMPISNKLHHTIYHVGYQIRHYGCKKRGGTDKCETLHKTAKASYSATNKQSSQISSQVTTVKRGAAITGQCFNCLDKRCIINL